MITGIDDPKRVVFKEGSMSGMIKDALAGAAEEIVSCDPTHNALIARAEDKSDKQVCRRPRLPLPTLTCFRAASSNFTSVDWQSERKLPKEYPCRPPKP